MAVVEPEHIIARLLREDVRAIEEIVGGRVPTTFCVRTPLES